MRLGGVAPRTAESGPECSRRLSHTSLRPSACVSCAKSRFDKLPFDFAQGLSLSNGKAPSPSRGSAVQWLHALKVRQRRSVPVSRASLGTR